MWPFNAQQCLHQAYCHHREGRLRDAESFYRQTLSLDPRNADALHGLGVVVNDQGRPQEAIALLRQSLAIAPQNSSAHFYLGNLLRMAGQIHPAMESYRHAIALRQDFSEAHNNLGLLLRVLGRADEAMVCFQSALVAKPTNANAHCNYASSLRDKGQLQGALDEYRQAIALNPRTFEAHMNMGGLLGILGSLDEGIAACGTAIAINPQSAEAHNELGSLLRKAGRLDECRAAYEMAARLNPGLSSVHNNLSLVLAELGQIPLAIDAARRAVALNPSDSQMHGALAALMHYDPASDQHAIAQELSRWNTTHARPLRGTIRPHRNSPNPNRTLRIGYVSADFRSHVSAHFLVPLLEHHDPQNVEVFCYSHSPSTDAIARRLQPHAQHWRDIASLSDEQAAEIIRADGIDILVDTKLHTSQNRLLIFAQKPAPVQVTWLGYPGSTGLETMDYRFSDPYLDPPDRSHSEYSEQTICLPDTFWCYDPLHSGLPVSLLPADKHGYVTFGCLNNFNKMNTQTLARWAVLMRAVPTSRLLLLAPEGSSRAWVAKCMQANGVDPARIEFASRQQRSGYLELFSRIDICLDTFPVNGHTTALDSFWMGVPEITLAGDMVMSRAGLSQLSNLGLAELAASSNAEFVAIGGRLATDIPRLRKLRGSLRERMEQSPLMDGARFAAGVEAKYREMWQRWCESNPANSDSPQRRRERRDVIEMANMLPAQRIA